MNEQEHIRQALHNEELFKKLTAKPFEAYDWAITVMFYCILHFVDAYLRKNWNVIPQGHTASARSGTIKDGRNDYVKKYMPRQVYSDYRMLYDASMRARYEGAYLSPQGISTYQKLFANEFTRLRQFFRQHLKS
ncbi:MAG TPA: HEPN domain-containing protein [Candidatus Binatia bacterium]|jgi:hypothetical protein|nr:HEPN domain-containing protein [Candidatus Binatia bacterium]